ncbi:MAG: hypothetical protein KF757_00950 [Phycisphaeraceae bacterium]|nr:hypothetical protein [Phycisphaeraceae bacterium]MCW5761775.1 hypothetical protein [Phycisphaeraceae bacterium]
MTQAQVDALSREIEGRPDSPRHLAVHRERRLLELGMDRVDYRVWHWNITNWRISQDHQLELTPYADFGRRGNQVWSLTPPQMMYGHVDTMPAAREPDVSLLRRKEEVCQVVFFGMGVGMASDLQPVSSMFDENGWVGYAANPDKTKILRWRGQISSDGETVWISEWEIVRNDRYPAGVGFKARFGEPVEHDGFATPVPERVQEIRPGGYLYREIILTGTSRIFREEFEQIGRIPEVGKVDTVRGRTSPTSMVDYRRGQGVYVTNLDAETPIKVPLHDAIVSSKSSGILRWTGWLLLAGLLTTGLLIARRQWQTR